MSVSNNLKKIGGSIHRIREFELEKVSLAEEFDILQIVGEGWFGKILLVEHRTTDAEMVLKALPKPYVSLRDFYREFHYGLHLGSHKNIVTTFDVAFETAGFYVFTQEYAPLGDLTSNVSETGIGELHTKRVAKQIASALDFMHSKELVHRDIKLDNVLVFRSDFSRVKLCDFGESRKFGTLVQRRNEWLPYSPPEVLSVPTDDTYKTDPSHDVWQFGIVCFVCLTGCLPWQKAAADDPRYMRYVIWHSSTISFPLRRSPKLFKLASNRACKMFRKFLEPRPDRRPKNLHDLQKFLEDRWLAKGAEKDLVAMEPDELCPSMYSFHSSPEEKNRLLSSLAEYGIETTVDRIAKKVRIRDWIQSSVIAEGDEEEEEEHDSGRTTPSSIITQRTPIAGHISSVRAAEEQQKTDALAKEKQIKTSIKDASNKHYDPRTGMEQAGPSAMGSHANQISPEPNHSTNHQNVVDIHKDRHEVYSNGNGVPYDQNYLTNDMYQNHSTTNSNNINNNTNNLINNNVNNNQHTNSQNKQDRSQMKNYQISQQNYSSSAITESGEQTLIDARLDFPLNKIEENKVEIRPPPREKSKNSKLTASGKSKSFNLKFNKSVKPKTASGLMTAFNSVATITVPEAKTNGQTVKDSGYGSMDRIKTNENIPNSPVTLVKRSSIKSSDSGSLNNNISGSSKDPSPFDEDDIDSLRGSTGFVNFAGRSNSMKDSPYDRYKYKN